MQTIQLRSSSSPDTGGGAGSQDDAWIDIEVGDDEGRRWLSSQSGLDEDIVGRLLEPAPATYWRRFREGVHFHLRTALPGADGSPATVIDLGIWLEPGRIITVRRGEVPAFHRAAQAHSRAAGPSSSWELIAFILSEGLRRLEQILHELTATIDQLEDEVLTRVGDPPLHRLAELQEQLVHARRFRVPLANMVGFIASQPGETLDAALRDELDGIANVFAQHQELLGLSIERASALQGLIRDQIADSMNSATFRFTWVATVFLPLSFVTGLLGINVAGIPGDHDPLAFWLVCGVLCVLAAAWGIAVGRATSPGHRALKLRSGATSE